jgi:hypothetical protein
MPDLLIQAVFYIIRGIIENFFGAGEIGGSEAPNHIQLQN